MKAFLKRFGWYLLPTVVLGVYLVLPTPKFPEPMSDFYWSVEPADRETPLRQAYYTNFFRGDVIFHYWDQMRRGSFLGLFLPTIRLPNYPPEDAYWLVRDQTRVNYLEELVHPMRESLFIAVLESRDPLTYHEREGGDYQNRVVVKYVISDTLVRVVVGVGGLWLFLWLLTEVMGEIGVLARKE